MITLSICLSDIPKESIKVSEKNGKKYVNVVVQPNYGGEVDKFGNTHNMTISQSKEEREAKVKKVYIGNGKEWVKPTESKPTEYKEPKKTFTDNQDDLPF